MGWLQRLGFHIGLVTVTLSWRQYWLLFCVTLACLLLMTRHLIASHFSTNPDVVALASWLLAFVAIYHIPDGLQIMSMFMLRCYKVTLMPLIVYTLFLWGIGLGGGYYLAYASSLQPFMQSPAAFWLTSIISLAFVAAWFSYALIRKSEAVAE
jgi:multidrug resistance protein, MATE family